MIDVSQLMFAKHRAEGLKLLDVLANLADPDERIHIIARHRENRKRQGLKSEHKWDSGYFSFNDLVQICFQEQRMKGSTEGVNVNLLHQIIARLEERLIATPIYRSGLIQLGPLVNILHRSQNLQNYVFGWSYIVERMAKAVPAINVRNAKGDLECGSGVILKSTSGSNLLITNRHVVEGNVIESVVVDGQGFHLQGEWIFAKYADLAKISVLQSDDTPTVNLANANHILSTVVSMGYPRIPTAIKQSIMAHRGEVNGEVCTYDGSKFLAISCHVSPGNSGGPLFDEGGYCAGLVTRSVAGKFLSAETTIQFDPTYHLAIGVEQLKSFVG